MVARRPNRLLVSAIAAPGSALVISLAMAVPNVPTRPGVLLLVPWVSLMVLIFTILGIFGIVGPVHQVFSHLFRGSNLQAMVLLSGTVSGALMFIALGSSTSFDIVGGALCGACSAGVWLLLYRLLSRRHSHA